MIPCHKTIYNNKLTGEDILLIQNLVKLLPKGIKLIDIPLTVLSEEDHKPEPRYDGAYDFEKLGYYVAEEQKIVLLKNAIKKASSDLDVPETGLRAIVFVHELGHYFTHQLPLWKTSSYNTHLFQETAVDVLEGWAQLFAVWSVELSPELSVLFFRLLKDQSPPYHVFERYSGSLDRLLLSLDYLRGLSSPAQLNDWSQAYKLI